MRNALALIAIALAAPAGALNFDGPIDVGALAAQARSAPVATPAPSAPFTPVSAAVDPSRSQRLISDASAWLQTKADARASLNAAVWNAGDDRHQAEWDRLGERVWALAGSVEAQQEIVVQRLTARVNAEETDPSARAARVRALADLMTLRRYTIYGNMVPRIIDEMVQDKAGNNIGRRYAGKRWRIVADFDDLNAAGRVLLERAGIPHADYEALEKSVADEYNAAHPLPPQ